MIQVLDEQYLHFRGWHLNTAATSPATDFSHVYARDSTLKSAKQICPFDIRLRLRQVLLGATTSGFGTRLVYLLRVFSRFGQYCYLVIRHLKETSGDKQWLLSSAQLNQHLSSFERG
jgi:hypothetical protein